MGPRGSTIEHNVAASGSPVDDLVLSTVNAPFKTAITADELADCHLRGNVQQWVVHIAAFFTDVNPHVVLKFAAQHGIGPGDLARAYHAASVKTGERNAKLEALLDALADTAGESSRRS